jgi:hypothetical protein
MLLTMQGVFQILHLILGKAAVPSHWRLDICLSLMDYRIMQKFILLQMKQLKILGSLSKFRLSSLVVVTSGAGYIAAAPLLASFDASSMAIACIGTGLW